MENSAQAKVIYKNIQYQLKLHERIEKEMIASADERLLYYTGKKTFPDFKSVQNTGNIQKHSG